MYHHIFCYDPKCTITLSLINFPAAPEENPPGWESVPEHPPGLSTAPAPALAQAKDHFERRTNGWRQILSRAAALSVRN